MNTYPKRRPTRRRAEIARISSRQSRSLHQGAPITMRRVVRINAAELFAESRRAHWKARRWMEICGLLVKGGSQVRLIPVHNAALDWGTFELKRRFVTSALRRRSIHNRDVIGTYHSHIFSEAEPGTADVRGAQRQSIMLIIACWDKRAAVWYIDDPVVKRWTLCVNPG